MMLFGDQAKRAGERHGAQRRAGTLLALLALLSQIVISILPMPAMAEASPPLDGQVICHADTPDGLPASKPGKSLGHHTPDCPVCQAFQLLGSLVQPAPIGLPPTPGQALAADFPAPGGIHPHRAAVRHRARAPPSV